MSNVESGSSWVMVPKAEYATLVRESERLAMIKRYIETSTYPAVDDIKIYFEIEEKEEKEDAAQN